MSRSAAHWILLALLTGLLLHLGFGSIASAEQADADTSVEDCGVESTKVEGADSDQDGVSQAAALPAVPARMSAIAFPPGARVRSHPGYRSSLDRPPDAHT